ncbi:MAG: bifunctional phosphopantothenoylcysteine decarboxylase/phosphopantothenate--cysteine ligase CoaBC [Candidatus Aminicenantes bacterium]|nr:bifunctional phosphopantothenoylcysteine decarboxylase/phosphopantothenate--cysteine ligase CoaBC [Candidatus Aminicenantes bacterium]
MSQMITLGVSSSISVYKSCEIIRELQKKGFEVRVICTANATRLISPRLFSALSGNRVGVDFFQNEINGKIDHIDWARKTDVFAVAPATANIIGKFAAGIADDFLSTFFMAVDCPVIIAPAMNEVMYLKPQVRLNMDKLKSLGVRIIEPGRGYLACGDEGWGRLAEPVEIVKAIQKALKEKSVLKGKTVLVTAGPTREHLDPVRFLSNPSSGKMGYALAEAALWRGADVILVSGPTHLLPPRGVTYKSVCSASEMEHEVKTAFAKTDILIMSAAVSDFRFADVSQQKIKKEKLPSQIKVVPTKDILKGIGSRKGNKVLVGFAAETENIKKNALKKLKEKNLDMIVVNRVDEKNIGFGADKNRVLFLSRDGKEIETETLSKEEIGRIVVEKIGEFVDEKNKKSGR